VKCQAGCERRRSLGDGARVARSVRRSERDDPNLARSSPRRGHIVTRYVYRDAPVRSSGASSGLIPRVFSKQRPDGKGGWLWA
jgi:hypothetical protein